MIFNIFDPLPLGHRHPPLNCFLNLISFCRYKFFLSEFFLNFDPLTPGTPTPQCFFQSYTFLQIGSFLNIKMKIWSFAHRPPPPPRHRIPQTKIIFFIFIHFFCRYKIFLFKAKIEKKNLPLPLFKGPLSTPKKNFVL